MRSAGDMMRQLIFLVVIDCRGSDVRCERFRSEDNRGFQVSSSGFWYGYSGMKLRLLVFLSYGANTTTYLSLST